MSSGKQNACSYRAGTKHSILRSHCDCQTLPANAATSWKTRLSRLFLSLFFNYRGQRTSHPRSKGVSQQTWQRSQSWNPSCVCVRERESVYDLCMEAMKKPIVVAPVCLISVYTTMSVVLWSPLVRLLCGALLWAEWEHRGKCRSLCVPYSSMCVIRDTHQRSRLSGCGHPASSASWMQLDLQLRGPAAPGSGGAAALCASRGLEESSSACLFTLCTLITNFMPLSTGLRPLSLFIVQLQGLVSPMYPKVSPDFYLRTCMSCSDNACI